MCACTRMHKNIYTELSPILCPCHMPSGWPDAEVTKSSGPHMTISCRFKQILKTAHHVALKCKILEQIVTSNNDIAPKQ